MAVNIKQITHHDLDEASEVTKTIDKGGDAGETISYPYKVIDLTMLKGSPFKLGYCCEVKGIGYPIFMTINGTETKFEIGKTGMFEFQPEMWKNINSEDPEEKEARVTTTEVKVPSDIEFTLDYCYSI